MMKVSPERKSINLRSIESAHGLSRIYIILRTDRALKHIILNRIITKCLSLGRKISLFRRERIFPLNIFHVVRGRLILRIRRGRWFVRYVRITTGRRGSVNRRPVFRRFLGRRAKHPGHGLEQRRDQLKSRIKDFFDRRANQLRWIDGGRWHHVLRTRNNMNEPWKNHDPRETIDSQARNRRNWLAKIWVPLGPCSARDF